MCCQPNPPLIKPGRRAFVQSIKKTKCFRAVYSNGRQAVNAYFVVYALKNNTDVNRLGISVSKKVGKAVVRSRVKRMVKEACRLRAHSISKGYDIVIVARPPVGALPRDIIFRDVDKALEALFVRLRLQKADDNG